MISLSYHIKIRYIQRILRITDEEKTKLYLQKHNKKVSFAIWNFFSKAKVLYKHFPTHENGGGTVNFYTYEDLLIITSQNNDYMITLYHIQLDYDRPKNWQKIANYIKTIGAHNEEIFQKNQQKKTIDTESRKIEFALAKLNELIENAPSPSVSDYLQKEVTALQQEREISIEEAKKLMYEAKELKNENYKMMKDIFKGYKYTPSVAV